MFRITTHIEPERTVLELQGRLVGAWVAEAESSFAAALATHGRTLIVDLSQLTFVDDAGRRLLAEMHAAGAVLHARGCAMRELVREIAAAHPRSIDSVEEGRPA